MAGGIVIERRIPEAPALAVRKRFRGYRPEAEKASKRADVRGSQSLSQIMDAWSACQSYPTHCGDRYDDILSVVRTLRFTAGDVEEFSLALEGFQHEDGFSEKVGFFLSALINSGDGSHYVVHTGHLEEPLWYLGYLNEKNIIVKGDTGDGLGWMMKGGSIIVEGYGGNGTGDHMESGSITVNGDGGHYIGAGMKGGSITVNGDVKVGTGASMKGGSITVSGDAGTESGQYMFKGSITIRGNADIDVGDGMVGGDIILEGDCSSLADNIKGGRIYHKGKLIVDK
jgi:hypothetical protein